MMSWIWVLAVVGCLELEDEAGGDTAAEAATGEEGDDAACGVGGAGDTSPASDSGDTAGPGDGCGEEPVDPGGPSQCNETCDLEEYPGYGWVLSCEVEVVDSAGDLQGGVLDLTVEGGAFGKGKPYAAPIADADAPGGACEACLDGDQLFFGIQAGEEKDSYTVTWQLTDASGRRSNVVVTSTP